MRIYKYNQTYDQRGPGISLELREIREADAVSIATLLRSGQPVTLAPARELEAATLPHHVEIDVTVRRYGSRGARRVRVVEVGDEPLDLARTVAETMPLDEFDELLRAADSSDEIEDGSPEARALIEKVLAMYPLAVAQTLGGWVLDLSGNGNDIRLPPIDYLGLDSSPNLTLDSAPRGVFVTGDGAASLAGAARWDVGESIEIPRENDE